MGLPRGEMAALRCHCGSFEFILNPGEAVHPVSDNKYILQLTYTIEYSDNFSRNAWRYPRRA
jgi:hypothetical protein